MIHKFFTWPFIKCEKGTNMTFNVIKRQLIIILVLERFFLQLWENYLRCMKRANFIKYKVLKTNCYMKGENMIKVVKFVYTMIVFLFLVLAATNVEGRLFVSF